MLDPCGQKCAAPQSRHALAAAAGWYVAGGHGRHAAVELWGAKVPGAHGSGRLAPRPHAAPAGHARQPRAPSGASRAVELPKRPGGQGSAAGEPCGQ